jgi:hypothetical protein
MTLALLSFGLLICAVAKDVDVYFLFWGNLREKNKLEELGVDETTILKYIFEMEWGGGVDWIDLAQDCCKKKVMNLLVL